MNRAATSPPITPPPLSPPAPVIEDRITTPEPPPADPPQTPVPGAIAPATVAEDLPNSPAACAGCRGRYGGHWLYVAAKNGGALPRYPAEYIEARIAEHGERVRGSYRARYRIPDRPLPPEIAFDLEGPSGEGESVMPWSGSHGLKGEIKLRPLSDNTLEVSWHVTDFGGQPGLGAGTAVLIRRSE